MKKKKNVFDHRPFLAPTDPEERARRDERLRAAGIRIPNYAEAGPMRPPVPQRPRWLAFLLRLVLGPGK